MPATFRSGDARPLGVAVARHRGGGRLMGLVTALAVVALVVSGCSDDEGSAEELCAAVRDDPTLATAFQGFDPTDTEAALEQLRAARVTLGELRDSAPEEARNDLSVEIDYVQALIEGLDAVEGRDAADVVAMVQDITTDHPDVAEAQANLDAFADASCR